MAIKASFSQGAHLLSEFGDSADNTITTSRDAAGQILVNGGAVPIVGGPATVANTALIQVFGQGGNDGRARHRCPGDGDLAARQARELLHHSDRGSQYTSEQFQRLMAEHGVVSSMSRSGNVWDNAAMESFFSSLKTERTARKTYRTRDQARADVFDYIERFYNPRRRHSTIGYLSPMEFERRLD